MAKYHGGDIWAALRTEIAMHRERLIEAFDAQSYERESAILDDIARKTTEKVEAMVDVYSEKKR